MRASATLQFSRLRNSAHNLRRRFTTSSNFVTNVTLDRVRQNPDGDRPTRQSGAPDVLEGVLEAGLARDRPHRLGRVWGQRAGPGPLPARHDNRSHRRLTTRQTAAA